MSASVVREESLALLFLCHPYTYTLGIRKALGIALKCVVFHFFQKVKVLQGF